MFVRCTESVGFVNLPNILYAYTMHVLVTHTDCFRVGKVC